MAEAAIGRLVTLDSVYELLSTNVSTEIQGEIDEIERQIDHAYAARVARALALLQFAEAVYTTEENLAAVLHPTIDAGGSIGGDPRGCGNARRCAEGATDGARPQDSVGG